MSYDPDDQRATLKEVVAGWILCLAMAELALGSTGHHPTISIANAGAPPRVAAACCPTAGARLPSFASCAAGRRDAIRVARGPMSLPVNPCG